MKNWRHYTVIDSTTLGAAPLNAEFGRPTEWFSFLGGPVWEWADHEGRHLGESNVVPPNSYGETTSDPEFRAPGCQVIPTEALAELRWRSAGWVSEWVDPAGRHELLALTRFNNRLGGRPATREFLTEDERRCTICGVFPAEGHEGRVAVWTCGGDYLENIQVACRTHEAPVPLRLLQPSVI